MIPDDWQMCTIEDCCEILDSRRIPLNQDQRRERKGNIPYWGANGILDYVDDYLFDEPLILMAEDGGYFGEAKTRPICNLIDGQCWVNNHAHVLRTKSGVLREWVYFWFVHRDITHYINGGTRSKLNQSDLRKLPLALPELSEQKKIAAILSSVDDAIRATQSVIDQTRTVKQDLMQQLLTRGIGHTRFKQTEIGEIPETWEVKKLSDLVNPNRPITYGIVQTGPPVDDGIPCVRVVDLVKRRICIKELITTTPEINYSYKRTVLQKNDIMFALRGEIGHVVIVNNSLVGANLTRGVALISPRDTVFPKYLLWVIRSPIVRNEILIRVNGSALREIPLGELKQAKVPVPPINEQHQIVEQLSSIDNTLVAEEDYLHELYEIKRGLMQDLLTGRVRVNLNGDATL